MIKKIIFLSVLITACFFSFSQSFASCNDQKKSASYGHAENFNWIKGALNYSGLEGPTWLIIYDPSPSKADKYQGKFLLFNSHGQLFAPPKKFKNGDFVRITGHIRQQPEVSIYGNTHQYTVTHIQLKGKKP